MSQSSPNAMSQAERIARVAELNDALRRSIHSPGRNQIVMTAGVAALIGEVALFRGFRRRAEIIRIVRDYDSFTPDNDPIGEHDFGRFEFEDAILYWKIDLYEVTSVNALSEVGAGRSERFIPRHHHAHPVHQLVSGRGRSLGP